jgi:hypothetical protein
MSEILLNASMTLRDAKAAPGRAFMSGCHALVLSQDDGLPFTIITDDASLDSLYDAIGALKASRVVAS